MKCPNINSPEFKVLEDKVGTAAAYSLINYDLDDVAFRDLLDQSDYDSVQEEGGSIPGIFRATQNQGIKRLVDIFIKKVQDKGSVQSTEGINEYIGLLRSNISDVELQIDGISDLLEDLTEEEAIEFNGELLYLNRLKNNFEILLEDATSGESKVIDQAVKRLNRFTGLSIVDKGRGNLADLDNMDESEASLDRSGWDSSFWLTTDSKKTTSVELRFFLSTLNQKTNEVDEDTGKYKNKKDIFGKSLKINFDQAYDELHRILVDLPNDYPTARKRILSQLGDNNDIVEKLWMLDLVERLDEAPNHILGEFMSNMNNHYVNMEILTQTKVDGIDAETGAKLGYKVYKLELKSAHSASMATATMMQWNDNLRNTPLLTYDENVDDYKYTISDADYNRIEAKYEILNKKGNKKNAALLQDYFKEFGIELEDGAANELVNNNYLYLGNGSRITYNQLVKDNGQFLLDELEGIKRSTKDVHFTENTLIGQSSIGYTTSSMALINAKYTPDLFVNSFRIADKSVYAYTLNHYAADRARKLRHNENGILDDLAETVYSRKSYYLEEFKKRNSHTKSVFKLGYVGLSPLNKASNFKADLNELTEGEHMVRKIGDFWHVDPEKSVKTEHGKSRKSKYFNLTTSNKKNILDITATALQLEYNKDGTIVDEQLDILIDYVIASEWDRIYNTRNMEIEGNKLFYFFPEMNRVEIETTSPDGKTKKTQSLISLALTEAEINDQVRDVLRGIVSDTITGHTTKQVNDWLDVGIGANDTVGDSDKIKTRFKFLPDNHVQYTFNRLKDEISPDAMNKGIPYYMANEYIFNYFLNNANMFQLFVGDIALYHKTDKTYRKDNPKATQETLDRRDYLKTIDNLGKRMASQIAPGYSMSNDVYKKLYKSTKYIQMYATSIDGSITEKMAKYYKSIGLSDAEIKLYKEIDTTDAQEYTTWREHLSIMLSSGRMTESTFNDLTKKLESGKELKGADLKIILNPMKPVTTASKFYEYKGVKLSKFIYIKSASIPLLPQMTKRIELEGLRLQMEALEAEKGIPVRFTYSSAAKVGMPAIKKGNSVFNEDGRLNPLVLRDIDENMEQDEDSNIAYEVLEREGFKIQQDVPFDSEKNQTNVGSQGSKLIFTNILDVGNFQYKEKELDGRELKKIFNTLQKETFDRKYSKFISKFKDSFGEVKTELIAEALLEELDRFSPTQPEIDGLKVVDGEFVTSLWMSAHSDKYSSLINSILYNDLIKSKTRGKSYVLGAPTGFRTMSEVTDDQITGIVATDSYNGVNLLPMRPGKKGEILPAQLLVSFNALKDYLKEKGEPELRIRDFMDGNKIDINKVPKEILTGFGFRIPTQSKSSMTYFEIVGFLPEGQGDLVIAPQEFITQMGSDFDLDKLFTYMHNTVLDKETNSLRKINNNNIDEILFDKSKLGDAQLENAILDIYISVMSNDDTRVQNEISKPLGFGNMREYKDLLESYKQDEELPTYLSPSLNRTKYMGGVSGEMAISSFASATVLNAVLQDDVHEITKLVWDSDLQEHVPKNIMHLFGTEYETSKGNLSNIGSLKIGSDRYKSDVFSAWVSAAVDNEIERLLDPLNINDVTFQIVSYLTQLGYEEDIIIPFINQPIIKEYVRGKADQYSILNTYDEEASDNLITGLLDKYSKGYVNNELADFEGLNAEDVMMELIKDPKSYKFGEYQSSILAKFVKIEKEASGYGKLLQLGNVDSKGMGKSVMDAQFKMSKIKSLLDGAVSYPITNLESLEETSISTFAYNNYAKGMDEFTDLFIESKEKNAFDNMVNDYMEIVGKDIDQLNVNEYKALIAAIKHYTSALHSNLREELLTGEDSILRRMKTIKDDPYFKNNPFLNKFNLASNAFKNKVDGLIFSVSLTNESTNDLIYQGLLEAMNNTSEIKGVRIRTLAEDLINYLMLDGSRFSPVTFAKFGPGIYYEKLGINEYSKGIDLNGHYPFILQQYIQHNPNLAPRIKGKVSKDAVEFFPAKDETDRPKYIKSGYGEFTQLYKLESNDKYYRLDILGFKKLLNEYSYPSERPATSVVRKNGKGEHVMYDYQHAESNNDKHAFDNIDKTPPENAWKKPELVKPILTEEDVPLIDVLYQSTDPMAVAMMDSFGLILEVSSIRLNPNLKPKGRTTGRSIEIRTSAWNELTTEELFELILHESIHVVTAEVLSPAYRHKLTREQLEVVNKIQAKRLEVIGNLNSVELNEYIQSLYHLATYYDGSFDDIKKTQAALKPQLDAIRDINDELDAAIDNIMNATESLPDYDKVTMASIVNAGRFHNYYALSNDNEFLAHMASPEIRDFIDSKVARSGGIKSIKQLILQLLEAFGLSNKASGEIIELMFSTADIYQENLINDVKAGTEDLEIDPITKLFGKEKLTGNELLDGNDVREFKEINGNDYLENLSSRDQDYMLSLVEKGLITIKC